MHCFATQKPYERIRPPALGKPVFSQESAPCVDPNNLVDEFTPKFDTNSPTRAWRGLIKLHMHVHPSSCRALTWAKMLPFLVPIISTIINVRTRLRRDPADGLGLGGNYRRRPIHHTRIRNVSHFRN